MGQRSGKDVSESSYCHLGDAWQGHVAIGVGDKTARRCLHSFAQGSEGGQLNLQNPDLSCHGHRPG
jgi:hypothetical protein